MTLPPGTRLGRYTVTSLLGTGGMGEVYLAQDTTLRRRVAIKLLPGQFARDDARRGRFEREAHTASSLNHPNILTIHEIGEEAGRHFIAMEYVDGESLRRHLAGTRMETREALDVAQQVAAALAAAHEAGIVHRDIKPENIMIRRDGLVKVLDFGLAKLTDHRDPAATAAPGIEVTGPVDDHTAPGVVMGTASYMSPEQARGLPVDARTDTWSLGVVLYEMVAGRRPFEGATTTDILAVILHREPPSLLLLRPDVPAELERIVEKALAKEREERYYSARDFAVDLKRLNHRLDLDADRERSVLPEADSGSASAGVAPSTASPARSDTPTPVLYGTDAHPADSQTGQSSIAKSMARHKRVVAALVGALRTGSSGRRFLQIASRDSPYRQGYDSDRGFREYHGRLGI